MPRKRNLQPTPQPPERQPQVPVVGKCPECGRDVVARAKYYVCLGWYMDGTRPLKDLFKGVCSFRLFRDCLKSLGKTDISSEEIQYLLGGKAISLENLKKKDGSLFNCGGVLAVADNRWGIKFVKISGPRTFSPLKRKVRVPNEII